MQCNINAKGKAVRLLSGLGFLLAGALTFVFGGLDGVPAIIGSCLLLGGGFMAFEGWSGWCVVRAMGFKTPV
jgi:hypothetical protein